MDNIIIVFIVCVLLLSYLLQIIPIAVAYKKRTDKSERLVSANQGLTQIFVMIIMWSPTIVLLVFGAMGYIPLSFTFLGLGLPSLWSLVLGFFTPIIYYLIVFISLKKFSDVQNFKVEEDGRWTFTRVRGLLDKKFPPPKKPIIYIFDIFIGILITTIIYLGPLALGEEIVWRGFLQPIFIEQFGVVWGIVFLGLIWGFWHLPINMSGYQSSTFGKHKLNALVFFPLVTISMAAIFGWITVISGTIWPAVIAHAVNNITEPFISIMLAPKISPIKVKIMETTVFLVIGAICLWLML